MKRVIWAAVFAITGVCASAAMGTSSYHVTDLGDLPGGNDFSVAMGINAIGQVTGGSNDSNGNLAFVWTPTVANGTSGSMVALPDMPGGAGAVRGQAINNSGAITGYGATGSSIAHAFLWKPAVANGSTGSIYDLGELPGGADYSAGYGINSFGQILGVTETTPSSHPFLWTPSTAHGTSGTMIDLGDLPGGADQSWGSGINDRGQVVGPGTAASGSHGFLWSPTSPNGTSGSMADIGDLPGGSDDSAARGINSSGQIAGNSSGSSGSHAIRWTPTTPNGNSGTMIDLGALPSVNNISEGWAINNLGDVVGESDTAGGFHAFVWSSISGIEDLNALVDGSGAGWTLQYAYGINDTRQIVGYGTIGGVTHGFLLTPVPEPGGLITAVLAGTLLLRRRRRR